ncbi:hypothetical protein [Shinella zoogloeoides]
MSDELWRQWQSDWRRMEETARRRGWNVTPLAIAPPAPEAAVLALEIRYGMKVPAQLREVLTRYSAHVAFGWSVPAHLYPLERQNLPIMSANRDAIWDIGHIAERAIPNFLNWKKHLADRDLSEAPNGPEMWEHQFPIYELVNGDMLTIDMSVPDGPQPVRYFSHELEMLHGLALAPDFISFVTEMSKLGFAGTEWASWMPFGKLDEARRTYHLTADSTGGRAWLAWLAKPAAKPEPDAPPPSIVEKTPAERALLAGARAGDMKAVEQALEAGARPDVVPHSDWLMENMAWGEEFSTALTYAVRADKIALAEMLLKAGATLDTRRLPVADAVQASSLGTLQWLVDRGARVNGWKDDRHWPIHLLITRRSRLVAPTKDTLRIRLHRENGLKPGESDDSDYLKIIANEVEKQVEAWIDRPSYLAMLEALLKAGAQPDARWDNATTMLMWADADDGEKLLRAGADVDARDSSGDSALHRARTPEKIRMLVAHGADVNALATPPRGGDGWASTPLQSSLLLSRLDGLDRARTLLDLKADPKKRDGQGRSTLCYCTTIESFQLIAAHGLDAQERIPGGGTLLHNLFQTTSVRASKPDEVAFLDFLLGLGLPVNAVDDAGQTMLHVAVAGTETAEDIALLLDRGADSKIHDGQGRRPIDLVPKSLKMLRAIL